MKEQPIKRKKNAFEVWQDYQPLAMSIEKQMFQRITAHSLTASQRVVQLLLKQHTHDKCYLQAIRVGSCRYYLDGSETGTITEVEKAHASRVLETSTRG